MDQAPQQIVGILEAGVDLLDDRAEPLEGARGGGDAGGDLGIDFGRVAEGRAVRDPEPGDPVLEAGAVVGAVGRQLLVIAPVGPAQQVEQEGGVGDGARQRSRGRQHRQPPWAGRPGPGRGWS